MKPNERIEHITDRERGDDTHCDRYDDRKTNRKEVDNVARFAVHSEEGQFAMPSLRFSWLSSYAPSADRTPLGRDVLVPSPTTDAGT